MSDYGFRVSKPGFDVSTAQPYELAMTSKNISESVFVAVRYTHNHTGTSSSTTLNFTPILAYTPQTIFFSFGFGYYVPFIIGNSSGVFTAYDAYMTGGTSLTIRTTTSSATTFTDTIGLHVLYNPV